MCIYIYIHIYTHNDYISLSSKNKKCSKPSTTYIYIYYIIYIDNYIYIYHYTYPSLNYQLEPHKAVVEVSKIGSLYKRFGVGCKKSNVNPQMNRQGVGISHE